MKWVDASKEKPPEGTPVLVRGDSYDARYHEGYQVAEWDDWNDDGVGVWHYGKQQTEMYEVTHWMPLPEPPK